MFACRHCRTHLDAYIASELPRAAGAQVARHLDACPTCYAEYTRRRDLVRDLRRAVPTIGRDHEPDFERLRRGILVELRRAGPPPRYTQMRYGLAALSLTLILIMPFFMGGGGMRALPPVQHPAPPALVITATPDHLAGPTAGPTAVASLTLTRHSPAAAVPTLPEPESLRGIDGSDS